MTKPKVCEVDKWILHFSEDLKIYETVQMSAKFRFRLFLTIGILFMLYCDKCRLQTVRFMSAGYCTKRKKFHFHQHRKKWVSHVKPEDDCDEPSTYTKPIRATRVKSWVKIAEYVRIMNKE